MNESGMNESRRHSGGAIKYDNPELEGAIIQITRDLSAFET